MNLLLAVALLLQDKTAEETLKKIEETFSSAKTITLRTKTLKHRFFQGVENELEGSISVEMKEGNRFRLTAGYSGQNAHISVIMVSDGAKIRFKFADNPWKEDDTPKDLNQRMAVLLCRSGMNDPVYFSVLAHQIATNVVKLDSLKVTGLVLGKDESGAATLAYDIKEPDGRFSARHWFDPATFHLIKTSHEAVVGGSDSTSTGTYEVFTLNADIPDEKFKLPAEKK